VKEKAVPSYYEIVDGVRLPARLGGHPALDFCNTYAGWDGVASLEYLERFDELALWCGHVRLLDEERIASLRARARREPARAQRILDRARTLRASLYNVLSCGGTARAWRVVDQETRAALPLMRLRPCEDEPRWQVDRSAGLAAPLAAIVWAAGSLLTSEQRSRVRACDGRGCGWLFLDHRGRRRWCSMAACGNRDKVRRFAERHHNV
jgi:predicted RNA-binding Zn ribbon-like protein